MRKIGKKLIDRLKNGDLKILLEYIRTDSELKLEVRRENNAYIYYRKGKALELKGLKVDSKYGNVPDTKLALNDPKKYFTMMKQSIDTWLDTKKARYEFDTQQKIAQENQSIDDKYIILDMEYRFEQNQISKEERVKGATFDLLGLDLKSKKIVFFELKKGLGATKGKSGIDEHIEDFETHFNEKHAQLFKENLVQDIKNIIKDKTELELLKDITIPDDLEAFEVDFIFLFHPNNDNEVDDLKSILDNRYRLILIRDDNYKL